jgi:glycosyltransferase involved in cell wall biosynthesis
VTAAAARSSDTSPASSLVDHPTRLLNVGISRSRVCGVRDYAGVIGKALLGLGIEVETEWLDVNQEHRPLDLRRDARRWLDRVRTRAARQRPDWIVWHYSVFSYSYRGFPVVAAMCAEGLRASGAPVVGILHELVYPFGRLGAKGLVYGTVQRAALRPVHAALSAVVVTTEERMRWLETRRWLKRQPTLFLPVSANTGGTPSGRSGVTRQSGLVLGVVGFASESYLVEPIVEAVSLLPEHVRAHLVLVGAPGPDSRQARRWIRAAANAGVRSRLELSGVLPASGYEAAIASLDVVLHPDADGPTSRKGTLAAALAAGKPIVAIDGPKTWGRMRAGRAVLLVPPVAADIAAAITSIYEDEESRVEQGRRARAFYEREQAPEVIAGRLLDLLPAAARG